MLVSPDFPDHWRTRLLVTLLGDDEVAPLYVIRLWAHCQLRRKARFEDLPQAALRAICHFAGDPAALEGALIEAGFVARDAGALVVIGWEETNATLVKSWANGARGGRPKGSKKPKANPEKTQPVADPGTAVQIQGQLPGTGVQEPDPIFGTGLAFLQSKGSSEKSARAFLGMLRKSVMDDLVVAELLAKAEELDVSAPIPWLRAAAMARKEPPKPVDTPPACADCGAPAVTKVGRDWYCRACRGSHE